MGEQHPLDDGCRLFDMGDGKVLAEGQWHRWFAWRPIWMMHTGWVWLTFIERQFTRMNRPSGVTTYVTNYRPSHPPSHKEDSHGEG